MHNDYESERDEYQPNFVRIALIFMCICFGVSFLIVAGSINYLTYAIPAELEQTRIAAIEQLKNLQGEAAYQFGATRSAISGQIFDARKDITKLADKHLTSIEADLNYKLDQTEADLNTRLNDTNKVLNNALYEYNETAIAAISAGLDRVDPVVIETATLLDKANEQEPMVYSRFLATTGELNKTLDATRRMGNSIAEGTPQLVQNTTELTGNAAAVAADVHEYIKPKKKNFFTGTLVPIVLSAGRLIF